MMPLKTFLIALRRVWEMAEIRYLHPSLYVVVVSPEFEGLEEQERLSLFFDRAGLDEEKVSRLIAVNNLMLCLVTEEERATTLAFIDEAPKTHHWIEYLADAAEEPNRRTQSQSKLVHFYGYKGGQGRSTVLTMLSKSLADEGYRVLAIDADIEAPSLPAQFNSRVDVLEATLLGCVQYNLNSAPQQVYVPRTSSGSVDLIACKPSGPEYNLDLAAFALSTSLNPSALQEGFRKITQSESEYDVMLVDHRSGVSSSILPIISELPGPTVICIRLDEQSDEADEYLGVLLDRNPEAPGLFVSFSLDPEDTADKLKDRSGARIEALLDILGECLDAGAERDDPLDTNRTPPEALRPYWISWFHDRSFLGKAMPNVQDILSVNRESLRQIREITALTTPRRPRVDLPQTVNGPRLLTNSGNTDEGVLIQTEAIRKLRALNSPYRYIFGRKGTGKTRLVRELVEQKHGTTLLSAEDIGSDHSINSANSYFVDLRGLLFEKNATDMLWWVILDCALRSPNENPDESLAKWIDLIRQGGATAVETSAIVERIHRLDSHRTLLIDGVETAFTSSQMLQFVQGLFRFLAFMQSNTTTSSKVTIRLFLRTDLATFTGENVEQQVDGRKLELSWDTQSIFNFALSRIAALDWFRSTFPDVVQELMDKSSLLEEGGMSVEDCSEILMRIFPHKYRRNNLLTITFLKTYFSEGEGEAASYYPRIYDAFLRGIDDPKLISAAAARLKRLEDGRVGQQLIVQAHDYASGQYLKQVAAELNNLVQLSDDQAENGRRVTALLPAFGGLPTPFEIDKCVTQVHEKLTSEFTVDKERVKSALEQMKRVGIFEDRPNYSGWWRAGRLFKNALGMKYVR